MSRDVIFTVIEAYLVDAVPTVKELQEEQHRTVRGFTLLLFKQVRKRGKRVDRRAVEVELEQVSGKSKQCRYDSDYRSDILL